MMCEGCTKDEHWRCGMQTWCECECEGSSDWGAFEIDPYELAEPTTESAGELNEQREI